MNTRAKLEEILNKCSSAAYRGNAAFLLAHSQFEPKQLIALLEPSIDDPSLEVRNNSMRVIYYLIRKDPKLNLDLDKVIKALYYPTNTDRNKAIVILRSLPRESFTKQQIISIAPILISCVDQGDHNAGNANQVLQQLSGKDFSRNEISLWKNWYQEFAAN